MKTDFISNSLELHTPSDCWPALWCMWHLAQAFLCGRLFDVCCGCDSPVTQTSTPPPRSPPSVKTSPYPHQTCVSAYAVYHWEYTNWEIHLHPVFPREYVHMWHFNSDGFNTVRLSGNSEILHFVVINNLRCFFFKKCKLVKYIYFTNLHLVSLKTNVFTNTVNSKQYTAI